jgi:membrane protein DedA with SNARE-associated domain
MTAQDRIEQIGASITVVLIGAIGYQLRTVLPWPSSNTFALSVMLGGVIMLVVNHRRRRRHEGGQK